MAMIDPGLSRTISKYGAADFSSCYNCGNCTAVCALTARDANFPRIFLRYGSLGMKRELLASPEPWLCYACGECSAACPRDAGPGDFMAAARRFAIAHHEPTGLTRLIFTSNRFSIFFSLTLAVALGLFMFTLKPENPVARWIFEWLPFNVIHDMGVVIMALTALSAVIGMARMARGLFAGMPRLKHPLAAAWTAMKSVVIELGVMRRHRKCVDDREPFFRNRRAILQPWFVHWSIMWGFLTLLSATILDFLFKDPALTTWWPTRIIGTIGGLFLMYGTSVALVYRIRGVARQYRNSRLADWMLLGSLWLAGLTGFWMEVVVMGDFASTSGMVVFLVHTVISMEMVLLFSFSKFAHAAYRPLALFSWFLRAK